MQLEDWLDDLCVRFIINLPPEELGSVERICFQVEEAQWFYEDFIRPLDPSLPSLTLQNFSFRIFQHCPLFSQWEVSNYTTAFAEFMAYKSRVPVRGAIMLNEAMDEVVLVKGWKKGASWSFPRGKINKDELDLDCAVREVYEETGFDIRAAGLVGEEKDMKYIEVNMREQNMRLYVFRGVPTDTYFEAKTRKEISKIEWYKLTDLPTGKKIKNQDAMAEGPAVNTNKFYMVAPFLVPLKKWIAQQRKRDNHPTSQAQLAPPIVFEEVVTDDEPNGVNGDEFLPLNQVISHGPSDLPEVSVTPSTGRPEPDPSSQLKQLLNINSGRTAPREATQPPLELPRVDESKSNALLTLLRQGSTAHPQPIPHTPLEHVSFTPEVSRSLQHTQPRPPPFSSMPPPPRFPLRPEIAALFPSENDSDDLATSKKRFDQAKGEKPVQNSEPTSQLINSGGEATSNGQSQPTAPYRKNGDPQFASQEISDQWAPSVPPASALPKLTSHTRSLLDAFKSGMMRQTQGVDSLVSPVSQPQQERSIFETIRGSPVGEKHHEDTVPSPVDSGLLGLTASQSARGSSQMRTIVRPNSDHQSSLLSLFRRPIEETPSGGFSTTTLDIPQAPVELSAQHTPGLREKPTASRDLLKQFLQHKDEDQPKRQHTTNTHRTSTSREGKTSATISGPLNQPQFGNIVQPAPKKSMSHDFSRSPKPTTRTLFDPNQAPAVKILARSEDTRRSPARSPKVSKLAPKSSSKPTPIADQAAKTFQPQILRRPQTESQQGSPLLAAHGSQPQSSAQQPAQHKQSRPVTGDLLPSKPLPDQGNQVPVSRSAGTATLPPRANPKDSSSSQEGVNSPSPVPSFFDPSQSLAHPMKITEAPPLATLLSSSQSVTPTTIVPQVPSTRPTQELTSRPSASVRQTSQDQSHRQNLLSLFSKPSSPSGRGSVSHNLFGNESPLSTSQVVSPVNDKQSNGVEAISTRSRMGSMASAVSGISPVATEKRQTAAGDRAFLLGYLGRIANQE